MYLAPGPQMIPSYQRGNKCYFPVTLQTCSLINLTLGFQLPWGRNPPFLASPKVHGGQDQRKQQCCGTHLPLSLSYSTATHRLWSHSGLHHPGPTLPIYVYTAHSTAVPDSPQLPGSQPVKQTCVAHRRQCEDPGLVGASQLSQSAGLQQRPTEDMTVRPRGLARQQAAEAQPELIPSHLLQIKFQLY